MPPTPTPQKKPAVPGRAPMVASARVVPPPAKSESETTSEEYQENTNTESKKSETPAAALSGVFRSIATQLVEKHAETLCDVLGIERGMMGEILSELCGQFTSE